MGQRSGFNHDLMTFQKYFESFARETRRKLAEDVPQSSNLSSILQNILTSTDVDDRAYVGVVFFSWNLNPSLNIGVDG